MSTGTYFIIGSDGVGKTTVLTLLKKLLPSVSYVFYDFEERGTPTVDILEWVRLETEHWVDVGKENQKNGKETIVCGFARPNEVEELLGKVSDPTSVILLDADDTTIRERISKYYDTQEKIDELYNREGNTLEQTIRKNIEYSKFLRARCTLHGSNIIDATGKSPDIVVTEIVSFIYKE